MKDQTKFEEDAMVIEPLSSVIIEPYSTMDEMTIGCNHNVFIAVSAPRILG